MMASYNNIKDVLGEFLAEKGFQWMLTITTKNELKSESELWGWFHTCIFKSNKCIFGKYAYKKGFSVGFAAFAEKSADGRLHLHVLMKDNLDIYPMKLDNKYSAFKNCPNLVPYIFFHVWQDDLRNSYEVDLKDVALGESEACKILNEESAYSVARYVVKDYAAETIGRNKYSDFRIEKI